MTSEHYYAFYRNDIYGITLIITEHYTGTFRNDILHKQNTSTIILLQVLKFPS